MFCSFRTRLRSLKRTERRDRHADLPCEAAFRVRIRCAEIQEPDTIRDGADTLRLPGRQPGSGAAPYAADSGKLIHIKQMIT